jgi:hypothetical protein
MFGALENVLTVECRYMKFEVVISEAFANACKRCHFFANSSVSASVMMRETSS